MGRMKDLCIEIIEANGGIPEGMTIADAVRMKELEIFEWKQYEREQEKDRIQQYQSQNPGEVAKIEQATKKFTKTYRTTKEERSE
jgi:hypothetical protein